MLNKNLPMGHNTTIGNKARVLTNDEWADLSNGLNAEFEPVGDPMFGVGGMKVPNDSLNTPHKSDIDEPLSADIIIGRDRNEEWYPFIDTMTYSYTRIVYIFKRQSRFKDYIYNDFIIEDYDGKVITFPEPTSLTLTAPEDYNNGVLYGYQTVFKPILSDVVYSSVGADASGYIYFAINYLPETQTSGFGYDTLQDTGEIVTSFQGEYLSGYLPSLPTKDSTGITLSAFLSGEGYTDGIEYPPSYLSYTSAYTPVGISWFDREDDYINRNVQLLIGTPNIVGSGGGSAITDPQEFRHPFKSELSGGGVAVGYDRESLTYEFQDSITIIDPDTDDHKVIEYPTVETIDLSAPTDYYVYYDLYKNATQWETVLKKSEVWPPVVNFQGNFSKLIGFANYDTDLSAYNWGQEIFECPTESIQSIRGEFEPWYDLSGSVSIGAGEVETFGESASIPESRWNLLNDTELWVQIISENVDGTPLLTIGTDLTSGTFPSLYESFETSAHFNYKIGEISNGTYIPSHKGKLDIDNTLLMPGLSSEYTISPNSPRLMAFHDSQPATVGLEDNDVLLSGLFLDFQVIGGGVNKIKQDGYVSFKGKTEDETGVELLKYDFSDSGTAFGSGSIVLSTQYLDKETDKGLVQTHSIYNGAELSIVAGDNIKISTNGNIATITGRDQQEIPSASASIDDSIISAWTFVNDEVAPGNNKYYGTNGAGTKGWLSLDIPSGTVVAKESLEFDSADGKLHLVNDEDTPGNWSFYGTNGSGVKGFQDYSTVTVVTNVQLLSSGQLQKKTRSFYVPNLGTESAWTDCGSLSTTPCSG